METQNTNVEPQVIIKEVIVYKTYTPAKARANKAYFQKHKEEIKQYYKKRFEEGTDEYREKLKEANRERNRRYYQQKKARLVALALP